MEIKTFPPLGGVRPPLTLPQTALLGVFKVFSIFTQNHSIFDISLYYKKCSSQNSSRKRFYAFLVYEVQFFCNICRKKGENI